MMNLKFALRTLFKTPFTSVIAILSIALGIGANTATFSAFEQVMLRRLPVQDPDRLVNFSSPGPFEGSSSSTQAGDSYEVFTYPMFRDLEKAQTAFTGIAAHRLFQANLAARGVTLHEHGVLVSGSYFPVLGIPPALGRLLGPEDDRVIGESHVVVLSHMYWRTRFGGDPGVLNETLILNGQSMTIVGVAPPGFDGTTIGARPYVFVPLTMRGLMNPGSRAFDEHNRKDYWAYLFARLKPGITLDQAQKSINIPYHAVLNDVEAPLQEWMSEGTMARFRAKPLLLKQGTHGQTTLAEGDKKSLMGLLLGITAFVLAIACVNVINILLARGITRAGEITLRLWLGASQAQVVAQLLTESCIMALLAGGAGVLVSQWMLDSLTALAPAEIAAGISLSLNLQAFVFAAALALGTGLLMGIFPAFHSIRLDLAATLKTQAGQVSSAKSASRLRAAFATGQIALSLALLVLGGLFTRSLFNLNREKLGMKVDNVVTFSISPSLNGYTPQLCLQLFERLEDALGAIPGVTAVTDSMVPLLNQDTWGTDVVVEGYKASPDTDAFSRFNYVGAGFFGTLGIPLISGREFTRADRAGSPKVAIVNEAFAAKFNLGREAVGKHIGNSQHGFQPDMEIVGIVQNSKYSEVRAVVPPLFFSPYRQEIPIGNLTFFVRTSLNPEQLLPSIFKLVAQLDPNLPVENLRTMPQQVRVNLFVDRLFSIFSAAFAGLATLLAAVGLYGVIAYSVAQRTREIGLRIALGASRKQVSAMVFRQVGTITLVGAAVGLALAAVLGRLAEAMLFQLQGTDPAVFCGSAVVLVCIAAISGYVPARRAAHLDPMQALRCE